MAVVLDATSQGGNTAGTTVTVSHTVAAGSNRVLLVCIAGQTGLGVSSVTYNGDAMNLEISRDSTEFTAIYSLVDPDVGTANIVVTKGSGKYCSVGGISFSGAAVDATSSASAAGTSTAPSIAITTDNNEGYVVGATGGNDPGTLSYSSPGTEFMNRTEGSGKGQSAAYATFAANADITHTWAMTNSRGWSAVAVEVYSPVITLSIDESIILEDTISRTISRSIAEVVTLVETFASAFIFAVSLIESVTLVESVNKLTSRAFTEAVTLVDTVSRTISRSISEVVTLVDTITQVFGKAFTESVSLTVSISTYLNGVVVGIWSRVSRTATSWASTAREITSWTKRDRQ